MASHHSRSSFGGHHPHQNNTEEDEIIRQVEKGLSPVVLKEVQREFQDKKNNIGNVTYNKDKGSLKKSSIVNPSQLQYQNNSQEDDDFLARLREIKDEYVRVGSLLLGSNKLTVKIKDPLILKVQKYAEHVKTLEDSYRKKLPIIKFNKEYQTELQNYKASLIKIENKLALLEKASCCSKSKINKEIELAGELLQTHDVLVQAWLKLEPRNIILNSGEVIIEKVVETEPNEEKIRALVAKYIKDFLPKQKPVEPIIQTKTERIYVPAEPDRLGKAYQLLYGQKNYAEALKILRELDVQGNMDAQATLGTMYMEGMGVKKDIPKAVEYFKKAMRGGNAESTYKMATLLEKGLYKESEDRQTNLIKAIEYYNKAAQKDDLNALTDLAFFLENGKYVQKDVNEAYKLVKRAADLYYPRALNNLGSMYFKGIIQDKGRPNDQKAFEYFKLASDQGYPKAFTNLGTCYEKGIAVKKSLMTAVEFYRIGAELQDVDGIFHLAYYTMEEASRSNKEEQYAEAADLFREALSIDPDYAEAHYYLGFLHQHGLGVDKDMKTAFRCYKKAADRDHGKAWTKVGTFLSKGAGVERDMKEALLAYDRAVELDDDEAMNILGVIYEEGIEVPPDYERAYEYYAMAAELGNAKARLNLGLMHEHGRIEKNIDEAVAHYVEAADMGNVTAQMMLSSREFNTPYKGSMSQYMKKTNDTIDEEIDVDTIDPLIRSSPNKAAIQLQFPNEAVSQYVKQGDMQHKPLSSMKLGHSQQHHHDDYHHHQQQHDDHRYHQHHQHNDFDEDEYEEEQEVYEQYA